MKLGVWNKDLTLYLIATKKNWYSFYKKINNMADKQKKKIFMKDGLPYKGKAHHAWKGGRTTSGHGYVRIKMPEHPRVDNRGYVDEHILVAEKALGYTLYPPHCVHHIDEKKDNNVNTNLVICQDANYHNLLHLRKKSLIACGNANFRKCRHCEKYDNLVNMDKSYDSTGFHHRECASKYNKEARAKEGRYEYQKKYKKMYRERKPIFVLKEEKNG